MYPITIYMNVTLLPVVDLNVNEANNCRVVAYCMNIRVSFCFTKATCPDMRSN